MDDMFQFPSQMMGGAQGKADTSQHMFGMMEELSNNFRDELQNAKSNLEGKEKVSKGGKKEPEKAEESDKVSDEESESVEEVGTAEVEEEVAVVETEEPLLEEVVDDNSEIVVEKEEVLPEEGSELSQEVEEPESSDAVLVETESEVEPVDEALPTTEAVEVATEEGEVAEAPAEEENILPVIEEKAAAPVVEEEAIAPAATTETSSTAEPAEELAVDEEIPKAKVPKKQVALPAQAKADEKSTIHAEAKQKQMPAVAAAQLQEVAQDKADIAPDDFHSLEAAPKNEEKLFANNKARTIALSPEESARIEQSLAQLAQNTQVKAPVAQKVSAHVLESLKTNNMPLARQIEAGRGQSLLAASAAPGKGVPGQILSNAVKGTAPAPKAYGDPRMENLKQKVVEQVRFQVRLAFKGQANEINMALRPKVLGQVKINLIVENQMLSAHFVVENQSVKDLLVKSSNQLQETLAQEGIDVQEIEVSVADQQDRGSGKAFASAEEQKAARDFIASVAALSGAKKELSEEPETSVREDSDPDSILNIVA